VSCPIETLLELIGDKWTLRILHELVAGSHRTQALFGNLTGISSRTLAAKLKHLESLGLINRTVFAEVPPRVEYDLTERGRLLEKVFPVLRATAEELFGHQRAKKAISHCPSCQGFEQKPVVAAKSQSEPQNQTVAGQQLRHRSEDVTLL
jgi:DNA-binding HxlR family transcriptional regulator